MILKLILEEIKTWLSSKRLEVHSEVLV